MIKRTNKNDKWKSYVGGRNRKARPKTFSSEEAAKKYAQEQGIKNYSLDNLYSAESSEKKLRIVVKQ